MQSQGFLQSKEWMEFQRSLGREVFEYEKEGISARIIKHRLPLDKSYLYIPHGPEMDFNQMIGGLKNPVANFVSWLRQLGKKEKSIFIKAEPLVDSVAQALAGGVKFSAGGGPASVWRKSKKEIQPGRTVIVDLEGDDNELLGRMHHKTRYNIKVADGHDISVRESDDVDLFLKLLKKTTQRDKFNAHPESYYRKLLAMPGLDAKLFLAFFESKPVAGAIVIVCGDHGYYLHGASDYEHRSLMAPYALHWQIMQHLKQIGVKYYDMWGIDARKWQGVTRFKLGWGGRTVEHPGSFDLPISRFWYLAYRLVKNLF